MEKKKRPYDNFIWCLVAGLLLVGVSAVLFLLLGERSVVTYHDQLDGELLCYIYQAKYLFTETVIPELMNGMGKTALTAPAPLFVLFYKVLPPFTAFIICQYVMMFTAFAGLYLLLTRLRVSPWVATICGVILAYLPVLPVYGLSMQGIPLVAWIFLCLAQDKEKDDQKQGQKRDRRINLCKPMLLLALLTLFALSSSLILSGFAVILAVAFGLLLYKPTRTSSWYLTGALVLIAVYLLCNLSLVAQVLGIVDTYTTHKEELVVAATPFWSTAFSILVSGQAHAASHQTWIAGGALVVAVGGLFCKQWRNRQWKGICILLFIAIGIAMVCAAFDSAPVVTLRNQLGGVAVWFQFSRISWLYPALWYTMLGLLLQWALQADRGKVLKLALAGFVGLMTAISVLLAGNWKDNVKVLLHREPSLMSWQEFYAQDVFGQIEEYLYETTGQAKEQYRVASLGICPAAALYNGFYCLDGYSNNYSLEYKHAFRQMIKPELEKNDYLRTYFDEWGNRCYLFSAQIPGYFTVEKGGFYFVDYEIDAEAFAGLGGQYLLSAAWIENAEENGFVLLRDEPFETQDSYYRIYLYGLKQ